MGAECPKQYLSLAGKCILEHTLERLLSHPAIARVIVALAPHDSWFETLAVAAIVVMFDTRWSIGTNRSRSLPPSSTMAMSGSSESTDSSRRSAEPVVSPERPALVIFTPTRSESTDTKSCPLVDPLPETRLSPKATIRGRPSGFAGGFAGAKDDVEGAGPPDF